MNADDVQRQIKQMVQFIKQEAQEKANEIALAAEEEFNIEKLQLIEAEKAKVRKEYERKEQQIDIKKKIEYSTQLNASRLKILKARDDAIEKLKSDISASVAKISTSAEYKTLLKDLLVQGFLKLSEPDVVVRVREVDVPILKSVLKDATDEYAKKTKLPAPSVELDSSFLPPPPGPKALGPTSTGGVVLASKDRRIVCPNTLDARLDIVFNTQLPKIRATLFGEHTRAGA